MPWQQFGEQATCVNAWEKSKESLYSDDGYKATVWALNSWN